MTACAQSSNGVFGVQAVSSISAGALVLGQGWATLNLYALPAVVSVALITLIMIWRRRIGVPATPA